MNLRIKKTLFTLLCGLLCLQLAAADIPALLMYPDSLPDHNYKGFRIQLIAIRDLSIQKKRIRFTCTAVNTGKEYLHFGDPSPADYPLVLEINDADAALKLVPYISQIKEALIGQKMALTPGQIIQKVKISFRTDPQKATEESSLPPVFNPQPKQEIIQDTGCMDLVIDSISVVRQSKNYITLKYTLHNIGSRDIPLLSKGKEENSDVGIKAYFSGAQKITKGAIPAGGCFVKSQSGFSGVLKPGGTYSSTIELSLEGLTKYNHIVILYVDAFQIIQECDETNNEQFLILRN